MLMDRYQEAIVAVLDRVKSTQREALIRAGEIVADAVEHGGKIYLNKIVHGIEGDLFYRGGGPMFYRLYKEGETELKEGDVLFVSSVSGRTKSVVDLSYDCMQKGIKVIALTSMSYATQVDPVHGPFACDVAVPILESFINLCLRDLTRYNRCFRCSFWGICSGFCNAYRLVFYFLGHFLVCA